MTSDQPPLCPSCAEPMRFGGFALCRREEDGKRVCRGVWGCPARHVWWQWADRPGDVPEPCPHPELLGW
ncbi:dehydrogenase [Streptomyces genisteinicus]|nr:dehydrogenase [Streptomyces genisteinicus]